MHGAAIECRIYAEDPIKFLPSPGKITAVPRSRPGPYVRDDSGVYEGSEISVFYDPMISKLIAWGATRAEAIERMARALTEYRVGGIKTNLAFHRRVMRSADFRAGKYSTAYIEGHKAAPRPSPSRSTKRTTRSTPRSPPPRCTRSKPRRSRPTGAAHADGAVDRAQRLATRPPSRQKDSIGRSGDHRLKLLQGLERAEVEADDLFPVRFRSH